MALFALGLLLAACGREGTDPQEETESQKTEQTTAGTITKEPDADEPEKDSPESKCKEAEYLPCAAGVTISFEQGTAGWSEFNGASISQTKAEAESGKASLEVKTNGDAGFEGTETTDVSVEPDQTYTAFASVLAPKGAVMQISARERDDKETEVGAAAPTFRGTGDWQNVEVELEFSAKGENIIIQVRTGEKPQELTFYLDSVGLRGAGAD